MCTQKKCLLAVYCWTILLLISACQTKEMEQSGAGIAMDTWSAARSYPNGKISTKKWTQAFELQQLNLEFRNGNNADWKALGPKNIGGRTLCLAFHPTDENIIYAGAAGGGLWKTTTAGSGVEGWEYVSTGFPIIGVAAIAIDKNNPNIMYIGTGEVYNYTAAAPGIGSRLTRGSYGIGILKTTDGGETWTKSLDWSLSELTGVQDIEIDPFNSDIIYAATTEGLFKTIDAGTTWENIHPLSMATDVAIRPDDAQTIFVAHGSYLNTDKGVYRSEDGGATFVLLSDGIPSNYEGKTRLDINPSNPNIMYASVADVFESRGLYRSDNGGRSWSRRSSQDVARYQGWYSHDVASKSDDPTIVIQVGVDLFRSENSGVALQQRTDWSAWNFGDVPVGGPEGPDFYVHADIHAVYFHPLDPNKVFCATDGGIFVSEDTGLTWEGRNGGYQTQQFYANFANSTRDAELAVGGMQDNSTAIYEGDDSWVRVLGGDGMSAAIDPEDDTRIYASYQNLNIVPSDDRGVTFNFGDRLRISSASNESRAFNGPFEIALSDPNIIYAGAQRLHLSRDRGVTWESTTEEYIDGDNYIITLEVAPSDKNIVYLSTFPVFNDPPKVFKTESGGTLMTQMQGLPDRVAMDFAIHPEIPEVAYVVFSGFGTDHVYKTLNGGNDWQSASNGLPDVPTNTIKIDPLNPGFVYIGNDLGVYVSTDGGANWTPFVDNLPDAIMAMDLSISPANRKLRVATHGHGVYETDLLDEPVATNEVFDIGIENIKIYPNPTTDYLIIDFAVAKTVTVDLNIYNQNGQLVRSVSQKQKVSNHEQERITVNDLANGIYYLQLQTEKGSVQRAFIKE